MHPVILGELAQEHTHSLVLEADAYRLADLATASRPPRPSVRRRVGLRLIATGERLAPECPQRALPLRGGRI